MNRKKNIGCVTPEATAFAVGRVTQPPGRSPELLALLDLACNKFRDRVAIHWQDFRLTYESLDRAANRLCNCLISNKAAPGSKVAVLLNGHVEMIVALIAIFRAGCVFVPLANDSPEERLKVIVTELSPSLFVVEPGYEGLVKRLSPTPNCDKVITIKSPKGSGQVHGEPITVAYNGEALASERQFLFVDPEAPRYVCYTSGSTGQPKGIVGRLKGLSHFINWEIDSLKVGPGWRVSQFTSPTFDAFFRDVFVPLCAGGTVCIPPDRPANLPGEVLVDWVDEQEINLIHCVPSLFGAMLRENLDSERFKSLKFVLLAGEVLPVSQVKRWRAVFGNRIKLVNLYGSTETTMVKCFHQVEEADLSRGFIPIGKPMPGAEVLVLDKLGNSCPPGTPGEIYVSSAFMTMGYLNNPEATSSAFVRNPLSNDPNDIVYRTGDLGVILEDGNLQFLGRRDSQVKIRGNRVELEEIQSIVLRHEAIEECAIVVRRTDDVPENLIAKEGNRESNVVQWDQDRLIAYLVRRKPVSNSGLRRFLEQKLPSYMVPGRFVWLEKLPLNVNGKVDLRALPEPGNVRPELDQEFVAPRNSLESLIADVWRKVLGIDRVGVLDDFLELGGDSLMVMQVLNSLRQHTRRNLSFRNFLANRTVAGLAEQMLRLKVLPSARAEATPSNREFYPLSLAQQGVWFLWKLDPRNPYYTSQGVVHLNGRLQLTAWQSAWAALLERHEALRARFTEKKGKPLQKFEFQTVKMPLTDLSSVPATQRTAALKKAASLSIQSPFDLEKEWPIRFQFFKFSNIDYRLLLTVHEIAIDLWSVRVLLRDLKRLYENFLSDDNRSLRPLELKFSQYLIWEENTICRPSLKPQEEYWQRHLCGDLPVLHLSFDRPRPAVPSYRGRMKRTLLSKSLSKGLKALSQREGATLFMTLLSAFNVLLHVYTAQDDLIVGTPVANRNSAATEKLVGFFLNMLPLRTVLSDDPSFSQLLRRVRETVTGAIVNADYPFMWMLDWVKVERHPSFSPVFQVMFNMLSFTDEPLRSEGLTITYRGGETGYTKYDLSLYAQEHEDRLELQLSYLADLFEEATIGRMLKHFAILLNSIVENPKSRISQLEFLDKTERQTLLHDSNRTNKTFGNKGCLHQLFEAQVEQSPDQTALIWKEGHVTFGTLNRRANQLANYLRHLQIGPESLVALCVEPSPEMMVALLAIMKAGGAYVALDPQHPTGRLVDILTDTNAPVLLLTEEQDRFNNYPGRKVYLDRKQFAGEADNNPVCTTVPNNLHYVVYTSSSTGKPKGVLISIRSVLNRLFWMWEAYPFRAGDVAVLQKSYALVASTWECFGGLLKGIPTLILSREELLDPAACWESLVRHNVSYLLASPPVLERILDQAQWHLGAWRSLRLATTSAEPITPGLVRRWKRIFPQVPLLNMYGATECSSNVTVYDTRKMKREVDRVPVGKPLANTQVFVLNQHLKPVAPGVTGELCVAGAAVARGYLNSPELTASKFVPNPYACESGSRLYRTGDLVRYRPDGELELIDRQDNQVKIRGFRVELGDVETALSQHARVKKAAVTLFEDQVKGKLLVAYLVADGKISAAEMRKFLQTRLPVYMVPSEFVQLETLPLTPNGKLDRCALPSLDHGSRELAANFVAPRTAVEKVIARIWSQVLGVEQIGIHDNFFDLGGHSLLATQVISRSNAALRVELTLRSLFEAPTIAGLASRIEEVRQDGHQVRAASIPHLSREVHNRGHKKS